MSEDPAPVHRTGTDVSFERLYAVHHRAVYYEYFNEENLAKWEQYLPGFLAAMEETG